MRALRKIIPGAHFGFIPNCIQGVLRVNFCKFIILLMCLTCSFISASEFTISSYNCGGLSDHYDYLRAASMQKIAQERHIAEPSNMSLNEKIQKLALKILFAPDSQDKLAAQVEWDQKRYEHLFEHLTASPMDNNSPNMAWFQRANEIITSYKVRPVVIQDDEVNQMLSEHLKDLSKDVEADMPLLLQEVRATMARRIFAHHLKYDIICLQEADYLDHSMFPKNYEVLFAKTSHSKNGIAWNKERFELIESVGDILGRAFIVQLRDMETDQTVLVASGHITGCNPYRVENDPITGISDSAKGDSEIQAIIQSFDNKKADLMIIGMDSNVTSLHPRLNIIKNAGFEVDYENYLEPTCSNPYQVLNTRIDWIALKSNNMSTATVTNIPVLGVGLNSIQTNMSDHKPIAAKITY